MPLDAVATTLAPVYCANFQQCFGFDIAFAADTAGCEQQVADILENSQIALWRIGVERGTVIYDGALLGDCVDALESVNCEGFFQSPESCRTAAQGTVPPGGACEFSAECQAPGRCSTSASMCPGVCVARGDVGAACENDLGCDTGLDCFQGMCAQSGGPGDPCDGTVSPACTFGLSCVGEDDATQTAGVCRSYAETSTAAIGEECSLLGDTHCMIGLFCVPGDAAGEYVCVGPSSSGGACRAAFTSDPCPENEFCLVPEGSSDGTCTPEPVAGEPCPDNRCAAPARCHLGMCVTPAENGDACEASSGCYSSRCDAGVCAPPICTGF